jgi:hypothetical protein
MSSKKVIVSEISPSATEKTVRDFFLFCGKINEFELIKDEKSDKQIAYVTFERDTAVKTALMLTNAVIGDSPITVKPADKSLDIDGGLSEQDGEIGQEEKPKSAIFAEILAAGFQLQDSIIHKGLEFDKKFGLSEHLVQYLNQIQENLKSIDEKYKVYETVTAKAAEIDNKFAVQDKIKNAASQAVDTSIGKIVVDYYFLTTKQVSDVHAEARRIADEKQQRLAITQ